MELDPQMRHILEQVGFDPFAGLADMPLDEAVALVRSGGSAPDPAGLVSRWEDRFVPGPVGDIPVRICWPNGHGPFPILMNFHGGGWMTGSAARDDARCQQLTVGADCITISVDYRLAPEHRFPAGLEDCVAVTRWANDHATEFGGDPGRIAVSGASAGANLAAAVAIHGRDKGLRFPIFQLLYYPVLDGMADDGEVPGGPFYLTRAGMDWYWSQYTADRYNPLASPGLVTDKANLAPALIITAALDPLAREATRYADALARSGVPVEHVEMMGVVHGFLSLAPKLDQSRRAIVLGIAALRNIFW